MNQEHIMSHLYIAHSPRLAARMIFMYQKIPGKLPMRSISSVSIYIYYSAGSNKNLIGMPIIPLSHTQPKQNSKKSGFFAFFDIFVMKKNVLVLENTTGRQAP